jgi:hypothetical protein
MHGSNEANNMILDRRANERVRCCGERLMWKSEQSRRNRKGWLNDISTQGVSFLIDQRRTPSEGESLEVRTDKRGEPMIFTVKRVTPEGDDLALVACVREPVETLAMAA